MAEIKEALRDFNPWWKEEFHVEFRQREIYRQVQKFLPMPQIIAFTGLRRVGKTTLMYKIVEDSIRSGFEPKNIVYFSFDEFRNAGINRVLKAYEEMMEKSFGKEKCLLLLDELQKLDNWEDELKRIYDIFGKNAKIIISGSESLFIRKKSKETLAGRMFEFKIDPLSFREFLVFKGVDYKPAGLYEKELVALFDEFAKTMGFPELVGIRDKEIIKKYIIDGVVEKVVYRDIPKLFRVKDISLLESVLGIFMEEPGQLVELSALARDLQVSRQTLSNYLLYLEESFLLRKMYNFSKSRRKVERKLKKYYPAVVSTDLLFREDNFSKSKVFEWLAVMLTKAEFFWRDPYKNEVDMVLVDKVPIPMEVKYGKVDTGGLLPFMKKFGVEHAYIISSRKEEKHKINGKVVSVIPAYKFFIEYVGHSLMQINRN